jgi:hypothetical protein
MRGCLLTPPGLILEAMTANRVRQIPLGTLGAELERDRLERRIRRLVAVIAALTQIVEVSAEGDTRSRRIRQALTEFEAEKAASVARVCQLVSADLPFPERP